MGENGKVTNGGIMTLKLTDEDGKISLTPVWVSQDMTAPLTPIVINGVMFAASSGEAATKTGACGALCLGSSERQGDVVKRQDNYIGHFSHTLVVTRQPSLCGASDGYVYAFGPSLERYVMAKH